MKQTKNLDHSFSSDVNMPLYLLIRFWSLYPLNNSVRIITLNVFFFVFFLSGGGGGEGGGGGGCGHMFTIP